MINSIKNNKKLLTPENVATFLPVFISTGIALIITLFFVIPESIKSNKVNLELNESIRKRDELENLKFKYRKINQKLDNLNNERLKIIKLISGTSNLDTLLANVGLIGRRNNIQFSSIVPNNLIISMDEGVLNKENTSQLDNQNLGIDPLLVEGIKKYLIDFSFKTDFINLLSFLRELEFQENIILIKDIEVDLINKKDNLSRKNNQNLNVKLSMTFYGKI